jgi:hypothetical protein
MIPAANRQVRRTASAGNVIVDSALTQTAAMTFLTLALLFNSADAPAGDAPLSPPASAAFAAAPLADIEEAFWMCDYIATTRGRTADVERCGAVYDALRARKFGGDFDQLVLWWSRHKAAQHERMALVKTRAAAAARARDSLAGHPAPSSD